MTKVHGKVSPLTYQVDGYKKYEHIRPLPKLTLVITPEQKRRLDMIDWGIRSKVFSPIIDDLCDLLEDPEIGPTLIGSLLSRNRKVHLKDIISEPKIDSINAAKGEGK